MVRPAKKGLPMAEPNVLLVRIDNRLIHGQVATQWNAVLGAGLIIVANDEVAANAMRQNLMKMAAPRGIRTRFLSVANAADAIRESSERKGIFVVVETPADALALVQAGAPIKRVNIGNMHMTGDKRQVTPSVAVDERDVAAFRALRDAGVELEIRRVPTASAEDVEKLFA